MAVSPHKPTTPARRGMSTADTQALTHKRSHKSLTTTRKPRAGRSHGGQITVRRQGSGAKRRYRLVDFRPEDGMQATVEAIEYDPNRSSNVALVRREDDSRAYLLAGSGMRVGDTVSVGPDADITSGNRLPLSHIPLGSSIYNIELTRGRGGQLVRSAGARAQLASREGEWAHIRLPSGEVRLIHQQCYATLGNVGNEQHQNIKVGSAGRNRHKGKRPSVRGKAMNPIDHPHGGGEGQTMGRIPRTPWGKSAIGKKTRRRKRGSQLIVRGRKRKKR